jgi:hypothetical protein
MMLAEGELKILEQNLYHCNFVQQKFRTNWPMMPPVLSWLKANE